MNPIHPIMIRSANYVPIYHFPLKMSHPWAELWLFWVCTIAVHRSRLFILFVPKVLLLTIYWIRSGGSNVKQASR
jgi:hypothetical protein